MSTLVKSALFLLFISLCHESACDEKHCVKEFFTCMIKNTTAKQMLAAEETCCEEKYNDSKEIFFITLFQCIAVKQDSELLICYEKIGEQCLALVVLYFRKAYSNYVQFFYDVMQGVKHPKGPKDCESFGGKYNAAVVTQCKMNKDPVLKTFCDFILKM